MKKLQPTFFPPDAVPGDEAERFNRSVRRWLKQTSKHGSMVRRWAKEIAADEDVMTALFELVCWHKVAPKDLLSFLEELRGVHVPDREVRARIRTLGRAWKEVESLAIKARTASEPYLGELRHRALDVESAARLLSKFFSTPRAQRPSEMEIAQCKADIKAFLRRGGVRDLNQYGWILLKAVFGDLWRAGDGPDPIEAFRHIPRPFAGKILKRADAERAMEKANLDVFKMEQAARKS